MTEIFKAGEHVKIIESDSFYDEDAGNQTGMVGTVVEGRNGGAVYVTFPHTGDKQFYYVAREIKRAFGTTPLPETFKVGDRVEFTEAYGTYKVGDAGTIKSIDPADTDSDTLLRVTMDGTGKTGTAFVTRFKHSNKSKPNPAPKYKEGDWVKVTGYSNGTWEGAKGKVTIVGGWDARDGYTYVIECHEGKPYYSGGFDEKYLKPTTAPRVFKFKVGDWVEVHSCCNMDTCNGTKAEVMALPVEFSNYYDLKSAKGNTSRYSERNLKATAKPFTPQFKVGDWVEITGWSFTVDGDKVQVKTVPVSGDGFYQFEGKPTNYGFRARYLKATTAPVVHKFKVGDLVTFNDKDNKSWQGGKARVTEVKTTYGKPDYKLEIIAGPPKNTFYTEAGMTCNGNESFMEAYVAPRWTDTAALHSSVRVSGRTIVKIAEDEWLFLYHDGSYSEGIRSASIRNNEDTANVFGNKPAYALTTPN